MVTVVVSQVKELMQPKLAQHNAWDFPEELPGNSIDPLGSVYLQPISELSYCNIANALCGNDMLPCRFMPVIFEL